MHPNEKDFFDFIYKDNEDRIVNIRDRKRDENQWRVNVQLKEKELKLQSRFGDQSNHSIYFIVGAPRTGSTLLSQILISAFELGSQYNAVAKYYMAPLYGFSDLINDKTKDNFEFKSDLGNTRGVINAHEFGYFWQYWLNYKDHHQPSVEHLNKVDVVGLQSKLNAITNLLGSDLLIKNQVYINFIIKWLSDHFMNSKFIFIERNEVDIVESILNSRKLQYGSYDYWWSLKPQNYRNWLKIHPIEQVCHQVCYTNVKIKEQLAQLDDSRYLSIDYSDLIENFNNTLRSAKSFFGRNPTTLKMIKSQISVRSKEYELPWSKYRIKESVKKVKELYN